MIERYSRPEMVKIWTAEEKYRIWFRIEAFACEAMENYDYIPKGTTKDVMKASKIDFDANQINEIEKVTKHDVISFLTYISQFIGESSRFVHQGLTSSDILDTCLNIQLLKASELIEDDLNKRSFNFLKKDIFYHKSNNERKLLRC